MRLTDVTRELFDYLVTFRRKVTQASAPNLDVVRHELELVFHNMEEKISKYPKLANEYRQVRYPLAVLADEIVLTSRWPHAKRWEQCLLEKKYFSSNIGGNQFFRLLSKVDRMPKSVVTIFFYCLAFGFRGGFTKDDPSLIRLKGRLYTRIAPPKKQDDDLMLPEAYRVDKGGVGRMPRVWKWRDLLLASIVVFLALFVIQRLVVWPIVIGDSMDRLSALDGDGEDQADILALEQTAAKSQPAIAGYTVKLGAFSSEVLAIHFSQQIEQNGIKSRILLKSDAAGKDKYLVLSGTFAKRDEAFDLLKKAEGASNIVSEMSVVPLKEATGDCIHGCN